MEVGDLADSVRASSRQLQHHQLPPSAAALLQVPPPCMATGEGREGASVLTPHPSPPPAMRTHRASQSAVVGASRMGNCDLKSSERRGREEEPVVEARQQAADPRAPEKEPEGGDTATSTVDEAGAAATLPALLLPALVLPSPAARLLPPPWLLCVFVAGGGEGVGVNTAAPSRSTPVALQVAVVGGEGGSTPLGWDGKGEYRAGLSETSRLLIREWQWRGIWSATAAALHPTHPQLTEAALVAPFSAPTCHLMHSPHISTPSRLLTSLQFSPCWLWGGAWGSTPPLPHTPPLVAVQVAVVGGEGGNTPLGWDRMGEYWAGSSEPSSTLPGPQWSPLLPFIPPSLPPPPSQQPKASWRSAWLW
ncbi:unnamed protein product [Closterium sp. NIES-65]|nr:unnamed protein product [Closterium sp. NIES-65]